MSDPTPLWPSSGPEDIVDPERTSHHHRSGLRSRWEQKTSFRTRLSTLVAAAVGVAIALAAIASYVAVRQQLLSSIDNNLSAAQDELTSIVQRVDPSAPSNPFVVANRVLSSLAKAGDEIQVVDPSSDQVQLYYPGAPPTEAPSKPFFKISQQAKSLAINGNPGDSILETLPSTDGGSSVRALSVAAGNGVAIQVGDPLATTNRTLADLRIILLLVTLGGIALATTLGWLVARTSIRPVERLTRAAEHVAATQDLERTIDEEGTDELARLAHSFNSMLSALAVSRRQQAQLVSDAGHELRTPLTSLRTNIEVMMRVREIDETDRQGLLQDIEGQLEELTTLVGDLVDLARQDEGESDPEDVRLDHIVSRAVERARRRAPSLNFDVNCAPSTIHAPGALLERAVMNVLDNAAKWSPPGGVVEVTLEDLDGSACLRVRDHGPGIAAEDLPHIFDRFYRAASARSLPGSGLGLAIVQRAVNACGGRVEASIADSGGTVIRIDLPTAVI